MTTAHSEAERAARSTLAFARAAPADLAAVKALLASERLPTEDVAAHIESFIVAREGDQLVGVVGVERLGELGLLRSLCVAAAHRRGGLGGVLCAHASALARSAGVRELYLLTTTARAFFERRGFEAIARDQAAAPVRATREFAALCPASAVVMRRSLANDPIYLPAALLPLRPDVPGARMWGVALDRAMLTYFEVAPHTRFETHSHDGEQITTVVEGELFFAIGAQVIRVAAGEVIAIPPGVPHAVYTGDRAARAFDAWSPPTR